MELQSLLMRECKDISFLLTQLGNAAVSMQLRM